MNLKNLRKKELIQMIKQKNTEIELHQNLQSVTQETNSILKERIKHLYKI
jgi:hypothetical protein